MRWRARRSAQPLDGIPISTGRRGFRDTTGGSSSHRHAALALLPNSSAKPSWLGTALRDWHSDLVPARMARGAHSWGGLLLAYGARGTYRTGSSDADSVHCPRGAHHPPGPKSDCRLMTRECHLTNRWSGRVSDKVPSSYVGARAAQLNR